MSLSCTELVHTRVRANHKQARRLHHQLTIVSYNTCVMQFLYTLGELLVFTFQQHPADRQLLPQRQRAKSERQTVVTMTCIIGEVSADVTPLFDKLRDSSNWTVSLSVNLRDFNIKIDWRRLCWIHTVQHHISLTATSISFNSPPATAVLL